MATENKLVGRQRVYFDAGQAELSQDEEHEREAHGVLQGPGPWLFPAQGPGDDESSYEGSQDGHGRWHRPLGARYHEVGVSEMRAQVQQCRREAHHNGLPGSNAE